MSFTDCIRSAVAGGKIKEEKGQEAIDAYERQVASAMAEGLAEAAARDAATLRAVEELGAKTSARKWEKINELRKQHELYTRVMAAKDEPSLFIDIGNEAEIATDRIRNLALSYLNDFVEQSRPRVAGIVHPVRHLDEIVRAGFGENVANPSAREVAESVKGVMDFLRKMANRQGASIPENKNVFLPQSHSTLRVRRVRPTIDESKVEWVNDHLESLDWEIMRYHGERIPLDKREEVLGKIFDTIATYGDIRIRPGIPTERLTERLARERFLYYKDADSWIRMNKKYGEGNLFQQTIGMVESMSRNIALMETFGPNPAASLNYMFRAAQQKASQQSLEPGVKTKRKTAIAKIDKEIEAFSERYKMLSRNLANSDESKLANVAGNIRTFVSGTLLSGAYIANLGDLALIKQTALLERLPLTGHYRTYAKFFLPYNGKNKRRMAMRAGLGAESAINMAQGLQRIVGPLEGGAWMKRFSDVIHRAAWTTPHTQAAKWAAGMEIMGALADNRRLRFDDLPMAEGLRRRGITAEDWDLLRNQPVHDEQGFHLLRPIDLFNKGGREEMRVAEKFMDYVIDVQRFMVPEADTRTAAVLGHGADPRTWRGQLVKSANMFLSFPATMVMNHLRKGAQEASLSGKVKFFSTYFLMLTGAGAFITQAKELANGRDPRDMSDPKFWLRATLNGGSFGILGDAFFGPGKLTDMASGSTVQFLQRLKELGQAGEKRIEQLLKGERIDRDLERELVQLFSKYGPWIWQVRLLLQRNVSDELLKRADPAAYRRLRQMERRREKELGQRTWWKSGESLPRRGPNFGAALGQ